MSESQSPKNPRSPEEAFVPMEPVLRIRDMTKEELGYWKKYNYSSKELIQRIIELESLLVEV